MGQDHEGRLQEQNDVFKQAGVREEESKDNPENDCGGGCSLLGRVILVCSFDLVIVLPQNIVYPLLVDRSQYLTLTDNSSNDNNNHHDQNDPHLKERKQNKSNNNKHNLPCKQKSPAHIEKTPGGGVGGCVGGGGGVGCGII